MHSIPRAASILLAHPRILHSRRNLMWADLLPHYRSLQLYKLLESPPVNVVFSSLLSAVLVPLESWLMASPNYGLLLSFSSQPSSLPWVTKQCRTATACLLFRSQNPRSSCLSPPLPSPKPWALESSKVSQTLPARSFQGAESYRVLRGQKPLAQYLTTH